MLFERHTTPALAAGLLAAGLLTASPASALTITFVFDFADDQYDGIGTMTFDNDPGAGGGFNTTLDQLSNLVIDWGIPNTAGFDQDDLVQLLTQTELETIGAAPDRVARFDHLLPLVNAVWLNPSGDAMTFITNGLAGDGVAVLLVPLLGSPTTGTFTAVETVPEPSSGALLALGLLVLAARRR